jgi:hypothetical protein
MGKATGDLTPEQRAAMAERARLLKSPRWQAEQERMRVLGEKLGIAEKLRKVDTASPSPPQRKAGGGRRPKFTAHQQQWLRKKFSHDLNADPRLAKHDAAAAHMRGLAKTKFKVEAGDKTLLKIIRPVLRAAKNNQK